MAEQLEQTTRHRRGPRSWLRRTSGTGRVTRSALRFGAACALVIATGAATSSPASAQDVDPPVPQPIIVDSDGATLAAMVNDYRVANGLNPLVVDANFSSSTAPHALLLSSLNPAPEPPAGYAFWCPEASPSTFYHDNTANLRASSPAGANASGENIAYRCSPTFATHARDIMDGWRNSAGHNENMLNPAWTHIGSVAVRWNNTTIAVQRFASVPGTPVPTGRSAAVPAPAVVVAPTPTPVPAPVVPAPTAAPVAAAGADANARAGETAAAAPATSSATTSEATTSATDNAAAADTSSATGDADAASTTEARPSVNVPQLAFTGTNLNLALLGLALIASGLGVLALPAVRRLDDQP